MATTPIRVDLDLNQNELQNAVIQNLASAPANPKEGQIYQNTTNHAFYIYTNGQWVNVLSSGGTFVEGTGIDISGNTISVDTTVIATTSDLSNYIPATEKGANNGVATLDNSGKVPSSQLPAYVDDVVDLVALSDTAPLTATTGDKYYNTTSKKIFTATATDTWSTTGEDPQTDIIYVDITTNATYRWSGSSMVNLSNPIGQATETTAGIAELATQSEVNDGTDDLRIVTPLKLASYTNGMTKKLIANNTALTSSGGVVTWTITNSLANEDVIVQIFESATDTQVMAEVTATASTITIKMNSASNISANTYRAIIVG